MFPINGHCLKIVSAIWQVTDNFKEKLLKDRLRQFSSDLLISLSEKDFEKSINCIAVLDNLVHLAAALSQIHLVNHDIIQRELNLLRERILISQKESEVDLTKEFKILPPVPASKAQSESISPLKVDEGGLDLNSRQKAILDYIRNRKEGIRLSELITLFPQVSPRTLRYDLQELCLKNFLFRIGNGRGSIYTAKSKENSALKQEKWAKEEIGKNRNQENRQ